MWHFRIWFSGHGGVGLTVGIYLTSVPALMSP